jgi:thiamine pyrophosphate-dependent acetolactate synthase large subunit-like protein
MIKKKVSDLLVDILIANNIDTVFGIVGAGNAAIFNSISNQKIIKFIVCHLRTKFHF